MQRSAAVKALKTALQHFEDCVCLRLLHTSRRSELWSQPRTSHSLAAATRSFGCLASPGVQLVSQRGLAWREFASSCLPCLKSAASPAWRQHLPVHNFHWSPARNLKLLDWGLRFLFLLFLPLILSSPLCVGLGIGRASWVQLVRWTLERAGPAFIKWGQWAATRPDLFPPDVCRALTRLHTGAPAHSPAFTRHAVEHAFHCRLDDMFDAFDELPVASGSIAQVHRGVLSEAGAAGSNHKPGQLVAVKVRHPGVDTLMQRDFALMMRMARISRHLPLLADLRLDESVQQFGAPLKEQLDLAAEARHLSRFNYNFRLWRNLSFPVPVYPLVTPEVLVETFEHGRLITAFVDNPSNPHNAALANLGRDCYLKMLLNDNFIHADLHPGNILVRVTDPNSLWGRITRFFHLNTAPHLVLLDVGMTAELSPDDQTHIIQFFKAITAKDGSALAQNILSFDDSQSCQDPEAFVQDMAAMFDALDPDTISEHTSDIISQMMETVRRHQVALKGIVSTVVVTTMVLEGWSSKLNPDIKVMGALRDLLPMNWHDRIQLTVDRFMTSDPAIVGV
ncbi:hypothetical protein WJX73_001415 [Symbiochloris irregularis]|uniref:ABC1 atypical kinase-like domain-containing protein n=1 Tax=Symbiochloris irregularis TaxID=706552 RepID=A0AAW1P3F2_9CHLO